MGWAEVFVAWFYDHSQLDKQSKKHTVVFCIIYVVLEACVEE